MPDFECELYSKPPLGDYIRSSGGIYLGERSDLALVSLAMPLGKEKELARTVKKAWGVALPDNGKSVVGKNDIRIIRTAIDQYFIQFASDSPQADLEINKALNNIGYTTDQTHGWVTLELSGKDVRTALERICMIDLHKENFLINDAARTVMEHMGALIVRSDEDKFLLMSASSSAISFLHAVETSIVNAGLFDAV